jgi:hypothetical protein
MPGMRTAIQLDVGMGIGEVVDDCEAPAARDVCVGRAVVSPAFPE